MIKREEYKEAFEAVRPAVLLRDGNRCVKCGSTLSLEIHHIEGYKRNEPELLSTLCYLCHGIAPMGRENFDQWMLLGESGVEVLGRRLAQKGLSRLKREQIFAFCSALIELGLDLNRSRMRIARERIRNSGIRCDGRHAFGQKPGEEPILQRILALRTTRVKGKPMPLVQIAAVLNAEGRPSRMGRPWKTGTVANILARESKNK